MKSLLIVLALIAACGAKQQKEVDPCLRSTKKNHDLFKFVNDRPIVWDVENVPIRWRFDDDFPIKYEVDAKDGFDYWERLLGEDLFEQEPRTSTKAVVIVSFEDRLAPRDTPAKLKCGVVTVGNTWRTRDDRMRRSWIVYWKRWKEGPVSLRLTMSRHEVGHALGMEHIVGKECIMHEIAWRKYGLKEACIHEEIQFKAEYAGR